jgi:hypothetical protein
VILVLLPGTYIRFESLRTGETLLEAKRLDGALIVHGNANRRKFRVGLDGEVVKIDGTLWDRYGPAVSFGDDELRFHTKVSVDCGVLPDGYDGAWTRNRDG